MVNNRHGVDKINAVFILVPMNPLERAIQKFGSAAALARAVSVTPMAISNWRRRGLSVDGAIAIERATDGAVTREELRPDIFLRDGVSHRSDIRPADPASSSTCSATLTPIREDEESHG